MLYLFQPLQQRLLRPGCASVLVRLCTGCFASLHVSVSAVGISALAHGSHASNASMARPALPSGVDRKSLRLLRQAMRRAACATLRLAHAGRPMTPGGYAILAVTVTVATALATLSALTCDDPESA